MNKTISLDQFKNSTEDEREKICKDFLGISDQECPKCHSKNVDCPAWGGGCAAYECDDCGCEWETKNSQVIIMEEI